MPKGRRNRKTGSSVPMPIFANSRFRFSVTKPEYFSTARIPKLNNRVGIRIRFFFFAKAAFHAFLPSLSNSAFASLKAILFFAAISPIFTVARYVVTVVANR